MYVALFEMDGWMGVNRYIVDGENPIRIIQKFEKVQDLKCLVMQGKMHEKGNALKEIKKLEEFVNKYLVGTLTIDEIKSLNVSTSFGNIKCIDVKNESEREELISNNPDAILI